ncbi:MAG: AsmA-like C-terminal domain-containing protein [Kiloniellales bacterium]|nr:AsmA-like C-terminal domain-containing protein [Kiloniellales bacterium]
MAVIVGLLIWRLSSGPVTLDFVTPYLESALSDGDAGVNVRVTNTVLTWDRAEGDLDLRALDVTVRDQQGRPILSLPTVEVGVSLTALLFGTVAPTRIAVVGARITLLRSADGSFHFGDGDAAEPAEEAIPEEVPELAGFIPDLLEDLQAQRDPGRAMSFLRQLDIVDGQLLIRDEQAGVDWWAKSANIAVRSGSVGLSGELSLDIAEPKEISGVRGAFSYHRETKRLDLVVEVDEVLLSDLALLSPDFEKLGGVDVALKGSLISAFNGEGQVTNLGFDVSGGPGKIAIADLWPAPVPVRSFKARGIFDGAAGKMRVEDATLTLGSEADPGPQVGLVGSAELQSEGVVIKARAVGQSIALDDLASYWPLGLNNNARTWVTENIRDGLADTAEINLDILLPEGAKQEVRAREVFGRLTYSDLSVHYLRPLPPVTGISGEATFNAEEFVLHPRGGKLGNISVPKGEVTIDGLNVRDQTIDIDLEVAGPIREKLELLDHERLDLVSGMGIEPARASGRSAGRLRFKFPLESDLTVDEIEVATEATLTDVGVNGILLDKDLGANRLQLVLDTKGMQISGPIRLDGLGMTLDWQEFFGAENPMRTRITARVPRVEVADWAAYGIDVVPYIAGPSVTQITATIDRAGVTTVEGKANLRLAKLSFPILGWSKQPGADASATATVVFAEGVLDRVEAFRVDAGDLQADGGVTFDPGNRNIITLKLKNLAVGRTRLSDVTVREGGEMLQVELGTGTIDLSPRLSDDAAASEEQETAPAETRAESAEGGPSETVQPFDLRAKWLDRVYFGPNEYLENVRLWLVRAEGGWDRMEIDGQVPWELARHPKARPDSERRAPPAGFGRRFGEAPDPTEAKSEAIDEGPVTLNLRLAPIEDGTRRLAVRSRDLGAILRALAIEPSIDGGKLEVTGETDDPDPASPIRGRIEADGFRVYDAPILAKVLTVASLTGIVESLGGEGLVFDRVTGDFVYESDRLSTELLRVYGTSLGITTQGEVDLARGWIDVEGTVVPAYFLNRILGAIPIIGNILIGGEGEGLIAFTYEVEGPSDNPDVSVNPLSALTPGFLRGIFDIFDSDGEGPRSGEDMTALPSGRGDR